MCQQLVDRNFGQSIKKGPEDFKDDNSIYQFIEDVQANALNAGIISQCEPRPGLYFIFQFEYGRILLSWITMIIINFLGSFLANTKTYNERLQVTKTIVKSD